MALEEESGFAGALARWRVPIGFLMGAVVLWLAQPTMRTLMLGLLIASAGETIRLWAAGHVEKSREVTQSGPYRFARHPLYVGSAIMGGGLAVATRSLLVTVLIAAYLVLTIHAAIATEERFLRRTFGPTYDRYRTGVTQGAHRRFSLERAWRNREYRAVIGLVIAFALLWLRLRLDTP